MDNEDFEADWTPCEAHLKKSCVPPSYPVFLRMYVLRLPHPDETTEIRSIELRHTVPISHKIEQETFFLHIGQYGYQKTQNFMLILNLKTKLNKSALIKSYLKKTSQKADFWE